MELDTLMHESTSVLRSNNVHRILLRLWNSEAQPKIKQPSETGVQYNQEQFWCSERSK